MCVCRRQELEGVIADLTQAGVLDSTTIVAAPEGCGLGKRYAALCSALSIGEQVRDQGGHSFVVLDDISCMVSHMQRSPEYHAALYAQEA